MIDRCRDILQAAEKRIEKISEAAATKKEKNQKEDEEEAGSELF